MSAYDFQADYLKLLLTFIGLTDIELVRLEGMAFGPDATQAAIQQMAANLRRLVNIA